MKRIWIFFSLVGRMHYTERIGVRLAWELAGVIVEHSDELSQWERVK